MAGCRPSGNLLLETDLPQTEMLMTIVIIGAGNVGSALGRGWLACGEEVIFGVPNPADPKYRGLPEERLRTPADAARGAEIVVLATPWPATERAVEDLGDLSGKIIIDCTNHGAEWFGARTRSYDIGWRTGGVLGAAGIGL